MKILKEFYLDLEKDIVVDLFFKKEELCYILKTPNHTTGNLIANLAKLCDLDISYDENGLKIIEGVIPSYIDGNNNLIYIFRLGNTKVANIYPDLKVDLKASISAISKTLMSQTKDYKLPIEKTIIKTYIDSRIKFKSDLHVHMNGILSPDNLIALGIVHNIRYPYYYVKKLNLKLSVKQSEFLEKQSIEVAKNIDSSFLAPKYYQRKVDDNTFIGFRDLILNNLRNATYNISKIRNSLAVLKDSQAVFTNLEKTYLYRYVFTKGISIKTNTDINKYTKLIDEDIKSYIKQMILDDENEKYKDFNLFEDKLLWIARTYKSKGIEYVEIADTTLVKKDNAVKMLKSLHKALPLIYEETNVRIRFLAAIRRIPLTILKDSIENSEYLKDNIATLKAISKDPYIAGSDIVGEELNNILELKNLLIALVDIAKDDPYFTIRIHAGENSSLRDNVLNSILIIKNEITDKMPDIRIGHGLYTPNLNTIKGKQLLKELKENNITLEFQLTSNIRLNNLNNLDEHPLKEYLNNDINAVVGSDGAALYGSNLIDEQLSLEKLLDLSFEEQLKMKNSENKIIKKGIEAFEYKMNNYSFNEILLQKEIEENILISKPIPILRNNYLHSDELFIDRIKELPADKIPVIIAGGSFNIYKRKSILENVLIPKLDELLSLDPDSYFFVLGHKVNAYEKYIIDNNKDFEIYAIIPTLLSKEDANSLLDSNINIRLSTESSYIATYKSFNYEIFERRNSILVCFDGDGVCENLIQEAKNGKAKAKILISKYSRGLKNKADSLKGYVILFNENDDLIKLIKEN